MLQLIYLLLKLRHFPRLVVDHSTLCSFFRLDQGLQLFGTRLCGFKLVSPDPSSEPLSPLRGHEALVLTKII
jgi:hypothetical protein